VSPRLRVGEKSPARSVDWRKAGDVGGEFGVADPAQEVEADHLVGALGGLAARPQHDQKRCDERTVDDDGHGVAVQRQRMIGLQYFLEPAEE